eukprot:4987931-Pyramimonas_sp.AAC.1
MPSGGACRGIRRIMDSGPERGRVRYDAQNGLYANDPWRVQPQQLPVPAGQPASFAPMTRAATPFGAPQ